MSATGFFQTNDMKMHDKYLEAVSQRDVYSFNGGNAVMISGDDYLVAASDTRLSDGYNILTRNQTKIFKLTNKTYFAASGCWCDVLTLKKILELRVKIYKYDHNKDISCSSLAELASKLLYNRRFFPYYIGLLIGGIDNDGKGHIYTFDPVGHFEEVTYGSCGNISLSKSFLDNQVGKKNIEGLLPESIKLSLDEAKIIAKDCLISINEREINCGDSLNLCVLTKDGITEESDKLRLD